MIAFNIKKQNKHFYNFYEIRCFLVSTFTFARFPSISKLLCINALIRIVEKILKLKWRTFKQKILLEYLSQAVIAYTGVI